MLLALVFGYLLVTILIGLWAARRVHNTSDYVVAGKHLPMFMVFTTTFATWFGAETVLGIPARFVENNLGAVIEDPFGAGLCLVLVGLFVAGKLYHRPLLTISDYYRARYGRVIEIGASLLILLSYLGWVSAQVTALGIVFHMLSDGAISQTMGMVIGTGVILAYTLFGGMWSVAVTDFLQMIILVVGLALIAWFAADLAGGTDKVIALAQSKDLGRFWPEPKPMETLLFISAFITMMFGSIPQQDVFQRMMSAKDLRAATWGPVLGGLAYILFAFVPMFTIVAALIVMPDTAPGLIHDDPQKVIPALVLDHMPFSMQVVFFGALLSALMSTASATLLAPSVTFVENIYRQFVPAKDDAQNLREMRIATGVFALCVLAYSILLKDKPIYEIVSSAYTVTLVGAFVPLIAGLYWKHASTQGAVLSMGLGLLVWALLTFVPAFEGALYGFPAPLAGFLAGIVGMVVGSLAPAVIPDHREAVAA